MKKILCSLSLSFIILPLCAQNRVPPYDLWTPEVISKIRDRGTLELTVTPKEGYWDVFFTSNPAASWFDDQPPYTEHRSEKIRIHAFLVAPFLGGSYPALVVGHGHGGHADLQMAQLIATLGYAVMAIDGPQAGQSTGGPKDQSQSWISVDKGPQYGFLYHWAYAGMRSLTVLEQLATLPGNPHKIDAGKLGVMGASMGGILTTQVNGIDDRVKAAVVIVAAGPWHHTLRYPNSWLYNSLYTETRDIPYNGADPLNSVENVDSDSTTLTFLNYFDPVRYAPRQNAPVLTVIGTHDEYFPMPTANLMHQAITSAGTNPRFEKRLWLLPNAVHGFDTGLDLFPIVLSIKQWLDYCFGLRAKPLATPQVTLAPEGSALRLEIRVDEPAARLDGARVVAYAGTRIDNTTSKIQDFKSFDAAREGNVFVARIPAGEVGSSGEPLRADNTLYYATITDPASLSVSSLLYRTGTSLDLSSSFVANNRHIPGNSVSVPLPPAVRDAAATVKTSSPQISGTAYQGMALTNPTAQPLAVRVEARTSAGRVAAMEGLVNPVFVPLPPLSQKVFVAEEWFNQGIRNLNGSFYLGWSDALGTSLGFRGDVNPPDLEGMGPLYRAGTRLWITLIPEQEGSTQRRVRIIAAPPAAAASAQVIFRTAQGVTLETRQAALQPGGSEALVVVSGQSGQAASVEIVASAPVSARLEVSGGSDAWSVDSLSPAAGPSEPLVQPHMELYGTFGSRIALLNTSSTNQTAILRAFSASGTAIGSPASRTIPAFGTVSETAESWLGASIPATRGAGWFKIELSSEAVLGSVLAVDRASGAAAGSMLSPAGTGPWSMPFFVENIGYYTGLAVANAGADAVNFTLIAYGQDGTEMARNADVRLGAGQSRTALVSQWLTSLPSESTGHIVITADGPLSLLSYFGTDDGASLAAIPIRGSR